MVIAYKGNRKLNEEEKKKKLEDYLYNTLFIKTPRTLATLVVRWIDMIILPKW